MDIFTRLATQQLAAAPLLRPALPSHFAPRKDSVPATAGGGLELHEAASAFAPEGPALRRAIEGARSGTTATAVSGPATPTPVVLMRAAASQVSDRRSTLLRGPSALPPAHPQPLVAAAAPLDRAGPGVSRDRIAPPLAPARGTPPSVEGQTSPAASPLLAAAYSARRAAPASTESPLSAQYGQVLLNPPRPHVQGEVPPVVHLHIDRIEVRAPTAPTRPAPPRAPQHRAPAASLSDYLRKGSRG